MVLASTRAIDGSAPTSTTDPTQIAVNSSRAYCSLHAA